ncbi:hypothetical protein Enr10x_45950 [Gimesia panareensis]|uniref:Uncharacterized protein n=1 Tax=Gimesia panareensis TaxID=2527978 RepID=A0A517QCD1_9PLAN|nr:hypothetical protein [Gimesia panareensis]QDT29245.1 hypothetical protein Enr10x_45950 [Gimesia panareensis]
MQHLVISPPPDPARTTSHTCTSLIEPRSAGQPDNSQDLSISVLEWLNAELRKEVEKQEIVAFQPNEKMIDRLQSMLTSKATGITIMVVGLFIM